jgi:hypothetical protein
MDRMTAAATSIYYPGSDGRPMGETDMHIDALSSQPRRRRSSKSLSAASNAAKP